MPKEPSLKATREEDLPEIIVRPSKTISPRWGFNPSPYGSIPRPTTPPVEPSPSNTASGSTNNRPRPPQHNLPPRPPPQPTFNHRNPTHQYSQGYNHARGQMHGHGQVPYPQPRQSHGPVFFINERTRIDDPPSPSPSFFSSRPSHSATVQHMREDVRRRVQDAIQRAFGSEYTIEFFGSTRYGVSFSDSDLDMVIMDPHHPQGYVQTDFAEPIYKPRKLADCIRRARFIAVETRPSSSVPIVKFRDPITGLECDLNVNQSLGIINSDLLKAYIALFPPLRGLMYAVKEWAKPLGLNNPAGTRDVPASWSSYALALMSVAWCMHQGILPNLQAGLAPLRHPSDVAVDGDGDAHLEMEMNPGDFSGLGRQPSELLMWTRKPHRGWDARFLPADEPSVRAAMDTITRARGPEIRTSAQLFVEWLRFWAAFDYAGNAVCIRLPGAIVPRDDPEVCEAEYLKGKPLAPMCVMDPFIRTKNCTVSVVAKTLERFKEECAREVEVQMSRAEVAPPPLYWQRDRAGGAGGGDRRGGRGGRGRGGGGRG